MARPISSSTAPPPAPSTPSCPGRASPNDPWDAEQQLIGADGQDWTPIHIPTFGRQVLFFRALVGSATPQRLYLYSLGLSQNCFNLVLHGTTENTSYDLLSTPALQATNNWAVETNFLGAAGQYWTPVSIPLSGRPSLFLSARSWVDSTGSGIPDWWLLQYLGTVEVDPYSDPAGDGWTVLQALHQRLESDQLLHAARVARSLHQFGQFRK